MLIAPGISYIPPDNAFTEIKKYIYVHTLLSWYNEWKVSISECNFNGCLSSRFKV